MAPAAQPAAAAPFVSAPAAPTSSTWAPKAPEPAQPAAQQPPQQPEPAAAPAPVQEEDLPPWEVDEPLSPKTLPEKEIPTPAPAAPVPQSAPSAAPADTLMLYPQWHDVVEVLLSSELPKQEPALIPYLRTSKAYFDGKRVLIDGGDVFRDFLRRSPESRVHIKDIIEEKTGVRCPIGPYTPPKADQPQAVANVEELLARMQAQGVDVIIEEKKEGFALCALPLLFAIQQEPMHSGSTPCEMKQAILNCFGGFVMKARMPQGFGRPDVNALMRQAQKMQEEVKAKQAELEATEYQGSSGSGMVEVTMTGKHEITALHIKPEAVDPDDVEMLEDLIAAAINDAVRAVDEAADTEMGKLTNGMNIPGL